MRGWIVVLLLAGSAAAQQKDPCSPDALGLKNVQRAADWKPPDGCDPGAGTIHSEADYLARCPKAAASGIDWAHVERRDAMNVSVWYLVPPAAADRARRELACTIQTRCE